MRLLPKNIACFFVFAVCSLSHAQDLWRLNLQKTDEFTFVRQGGKFVEGEKPKPNPDFAVHQYDPLCVYRVSVASDPDGSRYVALSHVTGHKSAGMIVKEIPVSAHAAGPYTLGLRYRLSEGAEGLLQIGFKDQNGPIDEIQKFALKRTGDAGPDGWETVTFPITVTADSKLSLTWLVGPAEPGATLFLRDIFVARGADVTPNF